MSAPVAWAPGYHAAKGRRVDLFAYERYVGHWSRMFVPSLLEDAEVHAGDTVLDVATGTGEAAILARSAVGDAGLVVGVDISPGMLLAASERAAASFLPVACDGQALPFRAANFDAVLCQLGLMFFPDPLGGLNEFRRVLRRNRRAAVCVISSPDRAPMWGIFADELGRELPTQSHTLHMSFSLADPLRLEKLFVEAGFREIKVTRQTRQGTVISFDEYWAPIEAGVGQLPQAYLALPEPKRRMVRTNVRTRLSRFEADGCYAMSVEMLIASGRA